MRRLLHISSSFISNSTKTTNYFFKFASHILPHPEKEAKGGQDALLASKQVLVVADGVGGWADSGIDPGLYSKRLVKIMELLLQKDQAKYISDPKQLVNEAVKQNKQTGSTTVCILTLDPQTGLLRSYYLGDSVFAILNEKQNNMEVAPQQLIEFNFPVQVGSNGFSPLKGVYEEFKIQQIPQDAYLVAATDGLWDNMNLNLVFAISCNKIEDTRLDSLERKVERMALATRHIYSQEEYQTPFYLKATSQGIKCPKKGIPDDVSIILAQIVKEQL